MTWHAKSTSETLDEIESSEDGLTTEEANARLDRDGPNVLPKREPPTVWDIILHQFKSPLIYILFGAAVVALAIGEYIDALFIAVVLILNAAIGTFQEFRAEKSSHALQQLLKVSATVLRDGESAEIDAEGLVIGDVILLESGMRVPADARILDTQDLHVDEALLTGESVPVSKDDAWTGDEKTPLGDQKNMLFAGAVIARGRARAVVVATGLHTMVGELAKDVLSGAEGKPPLIERMERFAKVVGVVAVFISVAVGGAGVAMGQDPGDMLLVAVTLAVSAIPEGLPVAITVALAVATRRMADRGVIVRRLAAVEGLGSCTLIASDKTGTLTCNELTARVVSTHSDDFDVTGEGFAPTGEVKGVDMDDPVIKRLALVLSLNTEARLLPKDDEQWRHLGDPTEVALLSLAHKLGRDPNKDRREIRAEHIIAFESERQYSATFHTIDEKPIALVKGAPEKILGLCEMEDDERARWTQKSEDLAARGMRVLAFADATVAEPVDELEGGLSFLALVGMIDPLRPGVVEAVEACHDAGIRTVMITGDHPVTAMAIASELRLADEGEALKVRSGKELEELDDLTEAIEDTQVFARVSPRQKLELVEAGQRAGHFVAVTGDGVNDAPALRTANIGVAMGKGGTDVARDASELVITDDNFATIVGGVEEGRVAFDNVRKVTFLLVSTGAAEILLVATAILAGMPLPLLPVQILWLNLVTNGIQDVALAFEPNEGDVLERKPRPPKERIFNRLMLERVFVSAIVMAAGALWTFDKFLGMGMDDDSARNVVLLLMVLFENVHVGNSRSETRSALFMPPWKSPILIGAAITAFLLHLSMMYLPIGQTILRTQPVSLDIWLQLIPVALTLFVVMELHKVWWRLRST